MKKALEALIIQAVSTLQQQGILAQDINFVVNIEHTRDKQFGDFACNVAMLLAGQAKRNPRELAALICEQIPASDLVVKTEVAGPGFINFYLAQDAYLFVIKEILQQGAQFGQASIGAGQSVHIEFVSANPTGPLHVGHGRGAAFGASVANLLAAVGYQVHREYYVNDAGRQMDILAVSVWLRYLEALGHTLTFPSNGYKGEYVNSIAAQLRTAHGDRFEQAIATVFADLPADEQDDGSGDKEQHIDGLINRAKTLLGEEDFAIVHSYGLNHVLSDIQEDLAEFGVHYQNWFSERSLQQSGAIRAGIERLQHAGCTYEKSGALWFEATKFGDEKDRVLVRENGQVTYFAADVAYHLDKFARGFDPVIDVLGADHHGYVPRIKAFLQALQQPVEKFGVLFVQFAILYRGKERVQMSTRSGSFVTLRQLREEVGNDAARFFYVMRKNEQHMDFDLELAKSKSNENPVYYIQYAHARICSVFNQLSDKDLSYDQALGVASLQQLTTEHERTLIETLARYPEIIASAATHYEPHTLAHYLRDLANDFHTYYNAHQFLVEQATLRAARLSLIAATKQVIVNGLTILGVSAPEVM